MTQDEIIEFAKCSGIGMLLEVGGMDKCLEHFAKLVEQRKVNQIADACSKLPFGDTAHSFAVWIREQ